ncbi:PIN domain-containing protein [Mycena olivaceomarginata]|nr:PIN domain-containing protein [Mycena olivaceomarginata]
MLAAFSPTHSGPGYFHATPNGDPQAGAVAHLSNATILQQIEQLVQDVEMQAPVDESTICLVVDTNVLLEKQKLLEQFVRDVEKTAQRIVVIIPGVVLHELDGQKKSDRLGWFARRASGWILEKVKDKRKAVKVQTERETCKPSGSWKVRQPGESRERGNDELILDCCMYFSTKFRTHLCSADINLRIESETKEITSISPKSGRDLMRFLLGEDNTSFAAPEADYTGPESMEVEQDDSMMDVDEELPKLSAQQAADLLHIQVIEHFNRRLVELVGRVGPELEDVASDGGVTASQHAPKWKNGDKHYRQWSAAECLDYLDRKRRMKKTYPRLDVFLTKPYANGARPGREWSYEAWSSALGGLQAVGEDWNDESILGDLDELKRHRQVVFRLTR